ncbi:MAG: hypothetical protein GWP91_24035 [Rhodobacterales bacterium]|nr:hypothetical protein [Rhodobacterales bacterium]
MNLCRKQSRRRRGSAAIEFAFLVPILILMLIAIIDLSNYFTLAFDTQRAAKDAAKVGATTILSPGETGSVIEDAAVAQARLVLSVTTIPCEDDHIKASWAFDRDMGYYAVTVKVQCPYKPLLMNLIGDSKAQFTMITQQQTLIQ